MKTTSECVRVSLSRCEGGAASCDESDAECTPAGDAQLGGVTRRSSLVDALLLVPSSVEDAAASLSRAHCHRPLHVPYVVSVCCQHLQTHGQFSLRPTDTHLERQVSTVLNQADLVISRRGNENAL